MVEQCLNGLWYAFKVLSRADPPSMTYAREMTPVSNAPRRFSREKDVVNPFTSHSLRALAHQVMSSVSSTVELAGAAAHGAPPKRLERPVPTCSRLDVGAHLRDIF